MIACAQAAASMPASVSVLDPAAAPSETDPPASLRSRVSKRRPDRFSVAANRNDRQVERDAADRHQLPIASIRAGRAKVANELRLRQEADLRTSLKPSRGFLPTPERARKGGGIGLQTVVLVEAETRPTYDTATMETFQQVVRPAIVEKVARVRSAIDTLSRSGDITADQEAAGRRYAREYETAGRGIRGISVETLRGGTGANPEGIPQHQLDCITSVRQVCAALGFCTEVKLKALLVDDLSFTAMAERLCPGRKRGAEELRAQAVMLLEQLSEHYRERQKRAADERRRRAGEGPEQFRLYFRPIFPLLISEIASSR